MTKLHVHWGSGIAIGEFEENDATVFVPAWANGCLDEHSIAQTPRFTTLAEAETAVAGFWERKRSWAEQQRVIWERRQAEEANRLAPVLVLADCGHEVPASQIMRASMGTTCPDCYDRMSN